MWHDDLKRSLKNSIRKLQEGYQNDPDIQEINRKRGPGHPADQVLLEASPLFFLYGSVGRLKRTPHLFRCCFVVDLLASHVYVSSLGI